MYGCARWLLGALITVWGVRAALVGRAGHSVVMPCLYSGRDPIEQLLVYWQLPYQNKPITVLAIIKGQVEDKHQDLRYRGRTYLSPEGLRNWNFTLHLSNLTLTDQGTYNCIVLKAPRAVTEKWQQDVALEVTADFSTPSVTSSVSGKIEPGQEVTLTCRSHGGLHQPRVMWQNSTSGFILDEGHVEYERSGDIVTVISRVSIKVTSSSNVSCSVENKHHNITSQDSK
ncbi:ICOS ligand [Discoglossus pictus]